MTTGIGKPVIRGMTHYRVVTLDNGQRTETQAWGHDHSPNVETASAERIEVIKGPSSVLYGSDALGGVINVVAPALPDAIDVSSFARGRVSGAYNHNIRGMDGTFSAEVAAGGLGARVGITSRSSGDMRTPTGVLPNTNNQAFAPEIALGYRGGRGNIAARIYSRTDDRSLRCPVKFPRYSGYQRMLIASRGSSDVYSAPLGKALIQANAGYEQNYRREFRQPRRRRCGSWALCPHWTGFAHLNHAPWMFSGTLGISGMLSSFENLGSKTLIPTSDTRTAALLFSSSRRHRKMEDDVRSETRRRSLSTDATIDWRACSNA